VAREKEVNVWLRRADPQRQEDANKKEDGLKVKNCREAEKAGRKQ
jgi:hypothetical protein